MANNSASENSRTKKFIINNRQILKQYAQKKQDSIGLHQSNLKKMKKKFSEFCRKHVMSNMT